MGFPRYDRYKDSGVEWLGEIPEHWQVRRMANFGRFMKGQGISKSQVSDTGCPCLLYGEIYTKYEIKTEELTTYVAANIADQSEKIHREDLCFTASGETLEEIGKCLLYAGNEVAYAGGDVIIFRQCQQDSLYLSYLFNSRPFAEQKAKSAKGEIVVHVYASLLRNIKFCLPPIAEQKRIAEFLDRKCSEIDAAIAKKQRLIELLDEQKTILINQAVTKGLDPNVPMKDSGIDWLGEIPEHWKVNRAKYLFIQSRLLPRKDDGVVTCYRDGEVTLRTNRRVDGYTIAILEQGYQGIRIGQLVINSMDAFSGSIGVSDSDGKCSPEYVICNPVNEEEVLPDYYSLILREMALSGFIEISCPAVRQRGKRMRYSNFSPWLMPVPPFREQLYIVRKIEQVKSDAKVLTKRIEEEMERLKELKQILIAEAVTGKIKV